MFRVMISFKSELEDKFGICSNPQEFYVGTPTDVCSIICKLSHLKPIITLQEVSAVNAESVLKHYEVKDV